VDYFEQFHGKFAVM